MRLTAIQVRRTCQIVVQSICSRQASNANREPMGSTTFGNVTPTTMIGLAMPQNKKIDRAGNGRVSVMVATG
ncbi:hypothetical protein SAMN05444171_5417 [Bradyrhizobium lablabi]|jgi:hypothetical protein|uniref:Uncharacterized protein n=2 Tax=Bradyrhizobium TaxID=374 RepID=A0ABY0PCA3_9BRAD|nr:hypothetical protein SAMN05444163_1752 [Bradyrhizobium ottawaense]SED85751.1 hypothetical protein SAMN05444171_5417 [Bradyrhizobium lablabi]SHL81751.1 hypothetical protein SAMN05444321_4203 [Bradyrhizobium lablabi]